MASAARTVSLAMRRVPQRPFSTVRRLRDAIPAGSEKPPPSAHILFYKDFGRPVAKVFLMAVFTYQLTYWAWAKLEKEDLKTEKQEINTLEQKLKDVVAMKAAENDEVKTEAPKEQKKPWYRW